MTLHENGNTNGNVTRILCPSVCCEFTDPINHRHSRPFITINFECPVLICLEICTACLFIVSCFSGIAKPSLSVTLQFKHPSCCSLPSPPSGSWLPLPDPGSNAGFFLLTGLFLTGGHVTVSVLLQALYLTVLIIQPTDAKK